MSQMDISIAAAAADHSEAESLSDNDIINHNIVDTVVGSLEHNQQLPVLTPRSSNIGYLERCGRWLMAVPRDDIVALQQTSEYREFLNAFDKLGEVCYMNYMHCKYILYLFYVHKLIRLFYLPFRHIGEL